MRISMACACGKKLSVKEELAGKRVKCPACGAKLFVADEALDDEPEDEKPPVEEEAPRTRRRKKKKKRKSSESERGLLVCTGCGWNREVTRGLDKAVMPCPKCGSKMNAPWDDEDDDVMSYPKRLLVWVCFLVPTFNGVLLGIEYGGSWRQDPLWLIFLVATIPALVIAPIAALIAHYRAMARGS